MDLSVYVAYDGALHFRTAAQQSVATLSPNAVTALTKLAQVPPEVNPIVHQHVQTIVQHLPSERDTLIRLGLAVQTDERTVGLTRAGQRLAAWLMHEWKPWARYMRTLPAEAVAPWRWNVAYRAGQVDRL